MYFPLLIILPNCLLPSSSCIGKITAKNLSDLHTSTIETSCRPHGYITKETYTGDHPDGGEDEVAVWRVHVNSLLFLLLLPLYICCSLLITPFFPPLLPRSLPPSTACSPPQPSSIQVGDAQQTKDQPKSSFELKSRSNGEQDCKHCTLFKKDGETEDIRQVVYGIGYSMSIHLWWYTCTCRHAVYLSVFRQSCFVSRTELTRTMLS